jgi:glycosyltransferase involved in cell wall biosynthesis
MIESHHQRKGLCHLEFAGFAELHFVIVVGQLTKLGGAERQAILLAEGIRSQCRARVSVLAWGHNGQKGRVSELLEASGIPYFTFPLRQSGKPLARLANLVALVFFLRREVRPDIFLPFIGFNCKMIAIVWKLAGARYTWWNQRDEGRALFGSRLERWALHHVPSVISNSYEGRNFLASTYGIPQDSIHIVPNGVMLPESGPTPSLRDELGLPAESLLLCMVANLTAFKDHETLLRAMAELRTIDPQIAGRTFLLLAGREDETTVPLKVLAFDLGIASQVRLLGRVDDIPRLLRGVDVVVHSSNLEGCPNAVLEAMANGKAVVGTDISGIRQALGEDARNLCLSPPREPRILAEHLHRFLSDNELRHRWELKNHERIANHFRVDQMVARVMNIVSTALKGR